jgi:hypothetical protein
MSKHIRWRLLYSIKHQLGKPQFMFRRLRKPPVDIRGQEGAKFPCPKTW